MEPFLYHVFVCDQKKPEGVPGCSAQGCGAVIEALQREIAHQGMIDEVQVTTCGSLGLCEHGPNMVIYPEGIWYCGVAAKDVPEIVCSHFKEGIPVERLMRADTSMLRAEILANRLKKETAMRAREAAGSPPDELLAIVRGFQESRALLSAIELDLFSALGEGTTAASVAARLKTHPRATDMLLNALTAMGLLVKTSGTFHNTATTARYLASGSTDNARDSLMHTVHLWPRWGALTDCVRAGTAVIERSTGDRNADWTNAFIAAMDRNAAERAPLVVRAVPLEGVRKVLDVGGGSGAYAIAFARAVRDLQVEILDLPEVLPLTVQYIERAGLSGRIRTRPGDLRADPLGAGFDLVFVSAICHMLSPEENLNLIQRCYQALAPQGRLVVQDFILEPDKASPRFAALFALNMLVGTQAGSSYSIDEYVTWMQEAGFRAVQHARLPGPSGLVLGTRA
jgi:(2Fe-2S) ferredoxin/SAM-dependent methyltransferase